MKKIKEIKLSNNNINKNTKIDINLLIFFDIVMVLALSLVMQVIYKLKRSNQYARYKHGI